MHKLSTYLGLTLLVIALSSIMIAGELGMTFSLDIGVLKILFFMGAGSFVYGLLVPDRTNPPQIKVGEKNEVDGNKTKL